MGKYNTQQRKLMIDFFKNNAHKTSSVGEICEQLNALGVSTSSVYRNIAEMEEEGIVRRVNEKNRKGALYQYIDPEHCVGVVHLICEKCNLTFHLNRHVSQMLTNMALENYNFHINEQSAVLYGKCENCFQM